MGGAAARGVGRSRTSGLPVRQAQGPSAGSTLSLSNGQARRPTTKSKVRDRTLSELTLVLTTARRRAPTLPKTWRLSLDLPEIRRHRIGRDQAANFDAKHRQATLGLDIADDGL